MNALVSYGTDSDSDDDDISPTLQTPRAANTQAEATTNNSEDEDDPILAALKDLQDFAASVNENDPEPSSSNTATDATATGAGELMEQDQDELQFLSFLQEIEAIPNPDDVQPPPPPPPPPPPSEAPSATNNIPPPPPPSSSTSIPSAPPTPSASTTTTESIHQSVQMIYNRLYHISLLPSASMVAQDLERRLLEFAIRIVDWKKDGLEEAYFLGQDLADALAQEAATAAAAVTGVEGSNTQEGLVAALPDFGGIVGSMIQYMFRLEQMVTPNAWMAIWDTEDEAYGFQHVRTGLYSPVYPSTELITTLDPLAPATSKHVRMQPTATYKNNTSGTYYSSTVTTTSSPSTYTTTIAAPALNPWAAPPTITTATSSPQSNGSEGPNSLAQTPSEPSFGTAKKKKRKIDDSSTSTPSDDSGALFDQSIHPSRRAALVKNGSASPGSAGTGKTSSSLSSSSSKVMPKKLASLLQRWNEKDVEMSDDDEDDDNDDNDQGYQDLSNSRTGANSQSLGGGRRR